MKQSRRSSKSESLNGKQEGMLSRKPRGERARDFLPPSYAAHSMSCVKPARNKHNQIAKREEVACAPLLSPTLEIPIIAQVN